MNMHWQGVPKFKLSDSILDHFSVFYMELLLNIIWKRQLVQNVKSRLLSGISRWNYTTPVLKQLFCLFICRWAKFKGLVLGSKALFAAPKPEFFFSGRGHQLDCGMCVSSMWSVCAQHGKTQHAKYAGGLIESLRQNIAGGVAHISTKHPRTFGIPPPLPGSSCLHPSPSTGPILPSMDPGHLPAPSQIGAGGGAAATLRHKSDRAGKFLAKWHGVFNVFNVNFSCIL